MDQAVDPLSAELQNSKRSAKDAMENMVWIAGGTFQMGSDKHYPEEAPAHQVTVEGFWIDTHTVTNEEFHRFVDATKYVTCAERAPNPEDYPGAKPELLVPASVVFQKPRQRVDLRDCYQWWTYVPGANWRHPEGPASSLKGRAKHPVVHVAYEDAEAYATWCGKELPSEAEWEFASRGDSTARSSSGALRLNPTENIRRTPGKASSHGRISTKTVSKVPHRSAVFRPTATASTIWRAMSGSGLRIGIKNRVKSFNPAAPALTPEAERDKSYDLNTRETKIPHKVVKGGSYLCAPNYCRRYRSEARMAQPVDTSTCHLGFRCIIRVRQ